MTVTSRKCRHAQTLGYWLMTARRLRLADPDSSWSTTAGLDHMISQCSEVSFARQMAGRAASPAVPVLTRFFVEADASLRDLLTAYVRDELGPEMRRRVARFAPAIPGLDLLVAEMRSAVEPRKSRPTFSELPALIIGMRCDKRHVEPRPSGRP